MAEPAGPGEIVALESLLPPETALAAMDPCHADLADLHPGERALVPAGDESRIAQFAAGRACARLGMARLGVSGPVLARPDGAPDWPCGIRGSITHKPRLSIALVGRASEVVGIGIDLEPARELPVVAHDMVLTPDERRHLAGRADAGLQARLIFSAKETYYKWFRSLGRGDSIGFADVTVVLDPHRSTLHFRPRDPGRWPTPEGRFVRGAGWLVTAAWGG